MSKVGRPAVFTGKLEKAIVQVIKAHGLTVGRKFLAEQGVQAKVGKPKAPVSISLPTLGKLAARHGVKLQRGRPAQAA